MTAKTASEAYVMGVVVSKVNNLVFFLGFPEAKRDVRLDDVLPARSLSRQSPGAFISKRTQMAVASGGCRIFLLSDLAFVCVA